MTLKGVCGLPRLRDQCEMEGSKKKPQKKATDKQVPEGVGQAGGGGEKAVAHSKLMG